MHGLKRIVPFKEHRTSKSIDVEGARHGRMRTGISVALALACCLAAAPLLLAQAPANAPAPQPQSRPTDAPRPPAKAPQPSESNPFPEDTNAVPVLPNATAPAEAPAWDGTNPGSTSLPGEDNDPVRSPDDPVADSSDSSNSSSSSSLTGLDRAIAPPPDNDKRGKNAKQAPEHQETAAEDENVGSYYLSTKNWRAALSRYQSALVLDPENPEVYWGLAEAQRHLGDFAKAKANYLKLLDYDPDSKHGKEAKKILDNPELAKAPTASAAQPRQ